MRPGFLRQILPPTVAGQRDPRPWCRVLRQGRRLWPAPRHSGRIRPPRGPQLQRAGLVAAPGARPGRAGGQMSTAALARTADATVMTTGVQEPVTARSAPPGAGRERLFPAAKMAGPALPGADNGSRTSSSASSTRRLDRRLRAARPLRPGEPACRPGLRAPQGSGQAAPGHRAEEIA